MFPRKLFGLDFLYQNSEAWEREIWTEGVEVSSKGPLSEEKKDKKDLGVSKNYGTPKWMVYDGTPY